MLLPPATLFWHGSFRDSHRYPNGVAELAGYWAETQIFGDVVLFDRGDTGEEVSLITGSSKHQHVANNIAYSATGYTCTTYAATSPSHHQQSNNSTS